MNLEKLERIIEIFEYLYSLLFFSKNLSNLYRIFIRFECRNISPGFLCVCLRVTDGILSDLPQEVVDLPVILDCY